MIVSIGFLQWMVTIAVIVSALTPVILLVLFVKDMKGGDQW